MRRPEIGSENWLRQRLALGLGTEEVDRPPIRVATYGLPGLGKTFLLDEPVGEPVFATWVLDMLAGAGRVEA